ncbi:MAG TPA: peroxidase-related enzyme [Hyphomonas sp.]|nr:peroxidase-related enzyme [Hyphomonas sp.]HRK66082.1 peroxidase-related enzyme [Hyphomonas sp.]
MANFPSLSEEAHLRDFFHQFQRGVSSLLQLHDDILRKNSELSVADRELIAAWVSGLNQCRFCFGAHRVMAHAFGISTDLIDALFADFEAAPVRPELKAMLRYARKLTLEPERIVKADAQALFEHGLSENAVYDLVLVVSLYAFMSRLVQAAGIIPGAEYEAPDDAALEQRRQGGYVAWGIREGFIEN